MITATEARDKTKYNSLILDLEKEIEKGIQKAIDEGKYICIMDIKTDTPDYVRDEIRKKLTELGYKSDIPVYEPMPYGCPSDQWRYYDTIRISWESNT